MFTTYQRMAFDRYMKSGYVKEVEANDNKRNNQINKMVNNLCSSLDSYKLAYNTAIDCDDSSSIDAKKAITRVTNMLNEYGYTFENETPIDTIDLDADMEQ